MKKKKEVYEKFYDHIKEEGYRYNFVAKKIGLSQSHLCNILKGHDTMLEKHILDLNKLLKTNFK